MLGLHYTRSKDVIRISKDVIFNDTTDFHSDTESPTDSEFNRGIRKHVFEDKMLAPSKHRSPALSTLNLN
jgi:hypothetical protein